ncbi:MAG TPA: VWA containing CoxE family protein [Anaeromyxobacteraceae bacterium]|nr:VWA containing CoxE family protein [Anaeromyxobacteraceae bacterium]
MFDSFFFALRERGVPVTPTGFLRLNKALHLGLVTSLDDLYAVGRAVLIKSERDFDAYDQVFAERFSGLEAQVSEKVAIDEAARSLLDKWLKEPDAKMLGLSEEQLHRMTGEELVRYFLDRLKDQDGVHHGGARWIGTGGTSPVGHSGDHQGGLRVGGVSRRRSATKVALERRYRDYSQTAPLTRGQIGEALKRLRHLVPAGARDVINVDETVHRTMHNAGEIEIAFDRRLTDRLEVLLLIDNGGWSMDPYVGTVQALFHYARAQFRELRIYYFHNTIPDRVWADPARRDRPETIEHLMKRDPQSRLIFVGDASMAPEELFDARGGMVLDDGTRRQPSLERLKQLAHTFRHAAWLNPVPRCFWKDNETISAIGQLFPMFELNLIGLEHAVGHLAARRKGPGA